MLQINANSYPLEGRFVYACASLFLVLLLIGWNITRGRALGRRGVNVLGFVWVAFCSAEYWLFGPFSLLGRSDMYHASIPFLYYQALIHSGGTFAHSVAGGLDSVGGLLNGSQLFSVELWAFRLLPLWVAVLFLNAGAIAVALSGGYRIGRSYGLARGKSMVVGLLASGGHFFLFDSATAGTGWGIAVLPWAFHLICQRSDRPRYYAPIVAAALLVPFPTHTLLMLVFVVTVAAWLLPPINVRRAIAGAAVFSAVAVLNWLNWLISFFGLLPEIARGISAQPTVTIWYLLTRRADVIVVPVALVGVVWLMVRGDVRFAVKGVAAMAVAICFGPLLSYVLWNTTYVPYVGAYQWSNLSDGYTLIGLIILARLLGDLHWNREWKIGLLRLPPLSAAYFAAVAVVSVAEHKALNLVSLQNYASQAIFERVRCLADTSWRPSEPFRVVTVPTLFDPSTPTAYGIDTFDGFGETFTIAKNTFWRFAVARPPNADLSVKYHWIQVPRDADQLAATVNLEALRMANVRFVLSDRPLKDADLVLAKDCSREPTIGGESRMLKWMQTWAPTAAVRPHYVYELTGSWPRVFLPESITTQSEDPLTPAFYERMLANSGRPSAIVADDIAARLGSSDIPSSVHLGRAAIVPSGFDLQLSRAEGESGPALVAINVPYSRFWRARRAGREYPVISVNGGLHLGVILDDAGGTIAVRFEPLRLLGRDGLALATVWPRHRPANGVIPVGVSPSILDKPPTVSESSAPAL